MSYINQINDAVGKKMTLRRLSNDGVNKWGDVQNESVETHTITATPEVLSNESQEVQEGDFESGDLRVYVETDVSGIKQGNEIEYDGRIYEIEDVQKHPIGNEEHYEARCGQV